MFNILFVYEIIGGHFKNSGIFTLVNGSTDLYEIQNVAVGVFVDTEYGF